MLRLDISGIGVATTFILVSGIPMRVEKSPGFRFDVCRPRVLFQIHRTRSRTRTKCLRCDKVSLPGVLPDVKDEFHMRG